MCNFCRNLCLWQNSEDVCARERFVFSHPRAVRSGPGRGGGEVYQFEEGKSGGQGKFNSLEVLENKWKDLFSTLRRRLFFFVSTDFHLSNTQNS